jgi:hypothetical protein
MPKEKIEHVDIIGQPLNEGNYVAVSHHNAMHVCQIKKITAKMMKAVPIHGYGSGSDGWLIYSKNTVLLSGEDAMVYILKYSGS